MNSSPSINRGQVLRFMLLPQILPRIRTLFGSGLGDLPFLMAAMFYTLRIIPAHHPFLRRENVGKYSIFSVIATAANNIEYTWKNIDKITIFGVILAGFAMIILQLVMLILALFAMPAYAYNGPGLGPTTTGEFFNNPNTREDLAFRLLDLVFGIPNIFNSKDMVTTPFHQGLHTLFSFYSYGILLVGTFVIIYLVIAIVMETAQSGVPFGRRFNKAWAPVRLIMFFGLLLPVTGTGMGLNVAQYFLLTAAKLGSNVATNAWLTFDRTTQAPYVGRAEQLVATPNTPSLSAIATFMAVARTCSWAEGRVNGRDIQPYFVYGAGAGNSEPMTSAPAFSTMVERARGGTLVFRFGVKDENLYSRESGAVFPYCGEIAIPISDQSQPGSAIVQQAYVEMIPCLWNGTSGSALQCPTNNFNDQGRAFASRYSVIMPQDPYPDMTPYINNAQRADTLDKLSNAMRDTINRAVQTQASEGDWNNRAALEYGWAGAGIWFNKIAEQNGALTSAIYNQPQIRLMPYVMEYIKNQKMRQETSTPLAETYIPILSSGRTIMFETPQQQEVSRILNQQFSYWGPEFTLGFNESISETHKAGTGNIFIDTINAVMGTQGLFDMCKNTAIHPLASLASLGKGLIDHSIRGFGMGIGVGLGAGIAQLLDGHNFGQSLQAVSKFFMTFASMGLILGFLLYYVLPFLPFIYFFFAVMTWVKGIFEAMIGMPLWALAHLNIEGEGMPGQSAESGYFYILETFLRPVVILVGFLGGIIIFGAMVKVLNEIFYLVIGNLSGHRIDGTGTCFNPPGGTGGPTEEQYKRGTVDEFFLTMMYAIIVYMIGLPCFKMVDMVADRIFRWMGVGIKSFGAMDNDPAAGIMKSVSVGAGMIGGNLSGMQILGLRR
jgi:conjugal transfer/type IV secretion protein DotA/TraY